MMRKNTLFLTTLSALALGGCVSGSDFAQVQSEVSSLRGQVSQLETQVNVLQEELSVVKGQRVVRLPTGAPLQTRPRKSTPPAYQQPRVSDAQTTQTAAVNPVPATATTTAAEPAPTSEEGQYNAAIQTYRSGNAKAAIGQLEQFNADYPNSRYQSDVLYYLGEANYTVRDFSRAQAVLEELVYQTPLTEINPKAPDLLRKVYQAKGQSAKVSELNRHLDSLRNPVVPTPESTILEANPAEIDLDSLQ